MKGTTEMKNSTANIGVRIKEIRTQKGITQSELCGDELTRNHLSLIESGKSLPSLKNVCYIANRLEIPVGYLFSDDENENARFIGYHAADKIKPLFDSGDFESCISVCRSIPESIRSDEIGMLYAKSLFKSSVSLANALNMSKAVKTMEEAVSIADGCSYLADDFTSACKYYTLLFSSSYDSEIPAELCSLHMISSYVTADIVTYMRMISGESVEYSLFRDSKLACHAKAISLIKEGKTNEAFTLLEGLSEDPSLPFFMRYRVYDDLERCASEVGEFKAAYSAAKKKLELSGR